MKRLNIKQLLIIYIFSLLYSLFGVSTETFAIDNKLPILIISSYNPETSLTADNIQSFQKVCDSLKITNPIVIENMNCRNFTESKFWKARFHNILDKYRDKEGNLQISSMLLLGQESWSSYLSQEADIIRGIPVVMGMVSSNGLVLPSETEDLSTWNPDPLYLSNFTDNSNVLAGVAYKYDISENIKIVKQFYPNIKKIALLTDNTFGGVVLQAHVKAEFAKQRDLELILIDGRVCDIYEVINKISELDENSALFLGTWRVDKNESYFLSSSLYTLRGSNKKLPVFSLTTIGLGEWAIAGSVPNYKNQGRDLALKMNKVLKKEYPKGCNFEFIANVKKYDLKKVREYNLDETIIRQGIVINDDKSIFDRYPTLIYGIIAALVGLLALVMIVSFFLYRTKKLNMSLSFSEYNNKVILNNIGVGLVFINKEFEVVWENCSLISGMEDWNFYKIKQKCYKTKKDADTPCQWCPAIAFADGIGKEKYEMIERCDKKAFSLLYSPIFSSDDKYQGCVIRIEDVTQREKNNLELQEAKDAAENADKLKSLFLANMSHEIRTPLNAIVGFSEILSDVEDPAEKKEFQKIIEMNNRQLLQLINDILDLSKIEAGTLDFHFEQISLSSVVGEVYKVFEHQCKDKLLDFKISIPDDQYYILSDKNRVTQVLSNFMTNALKFTKQGYIKIGFVEREHDFKIFVEDTGMGISEDKRKAVFDRFVKLNTFAQGTGLGLSICMMIVNRLKGEIGVDSTVGKGSIFWFTIPKS